MNDILMGIDRQRVTALAALYISAAFDTVDHTILLNVLNETYGIKASASKWVEDYLKDRSTKVKINNTVSADKKLPFSVPQGSCAGPVFNNLHASTLGDTIQ